MRLLFAAFLIAMAATASADAARAPLTSFDDVPFGATFETAEAKLAPAFRSQPNISERALVADRLRLYGVDSRALLRFGGQGLFDRAYLTVAAPASACRATWGALTAQLRTLYGKADRAGADANAVFQSVRYDFPNGARIEAHKLGCAIDVVVSAPDARKYVQP